jgi:tRNA threonylcarbamoyladenosine biosynthesis protein TsaB
VIVLAVHSSSPHLGAAVLKDGETLSQRILPPGREHLEQVAGIVQQAVAEADVSLEQIDGLGVAVGPGSFSGIRVGMSFVKGLALALNKPVAGISSLEIMARQGLREGECGIALIDARRSEVYVAAYKNEDGRLVQLVPPALIPAAKLEEMTAACSEPLVFCGEPVAELLAASCRRVSRTRVVTPSPAVCARIAWERLQEGHADHVHALTPLYIRRSDAEEKRANRNHSLSGGVNSVGTI